jgi:hypothetical protein
MRNMNVKKFSMFVMLLGLIFIGYGGIRYVVNGPLKEPAWNPLSSESLSASMAVSDENVYRRVRRRSSANFAIAGAIVLFVGGALFVSSRRPVAPSEAT